MGAVALERLSGGKGAADAEEDKGLATVWVAMTTATLCAVFAVVLALGQVVVVRHRAGVRRTWRPWPQPIGHFKGLGRRAGPPGRWPRRRGPWWSGAWCSGRSPM